MVQTEQDLVNEAARRMSFEKLDMHGEIPIGHAKPELPGTREKRDEIAEGQDVKRAGTNPKI